LRAPDLLSLNMDWLLYIVARTFVAGLQALPLRLVARLGRMGGAAAYWIDARHRRVARTGLARAFGAEKSRSEIRALAKENFRRVGENYACAIKTASLSLEHLKPHLEFVCGPELLHPPGTTPPNLVVAIGHFGNFELYARFGQLCPAYQCATTYRGLRQESLNRVMQQLREQSGCRFFERRTDAAALRAFMNGQGVMLGLLADQHAGNGLRLPFFGRECSSSTAPAIFALRYRCTLRTGICYRVGLAQWRVEAGPEIPTHENGAARSVAEITLDINRAFEAAIRRDPANWFWVHNRWKPPKNSTPRAAGLPLE
jgi:KDO2-lipid IV(A) lauroyltransferase